MPRGDSVAEVLEEGEAKPIEYAQGGGRDGRPEEADGPGSRLEVAEDPARGERGDRHGLPRVRRRAQGTDAAEDLDPVAAQEAGDAAGTGDAQRSARGDPSPLPEDR